MEIELVLHEYLDHCNGHFDAVIGISKSRKKQSMYMHTSADSLNNHFPDRQTCSYGFRINFFRSRYSHSDRDFYITIQVF